MLLYLIYIFIKYRQSNKLDLMYNNIIKNRNHLVFHYLSFNLVGIITRDLSAFQKLVGVVQPLTEIGPIVIEALGIL